MRGKRLHYGRYTQDWAEATIGRFEQSMFQAIWDQAVKEATFPYRHLKALRSKPGSDDLLKAHFLWRWRRGLAGMGTF
jgi:hypothetical protein